MRKINKHLDAHQLAKVRTFLKFGTVGGSGVIVNNLILWLLTRAGMGDVYAAIIATEVAIITNFIGNSLWTWGDHTEGSWKKRFLMFQGISLIAGSLTVLLFYVFRTYLSLPLLIANTAAILITFIVNFTLNSKITWKKQDDKDNEKKNEKRNAAISMNKQKNVRPESHKTIQTQNGAPKNSHIAAPVRVHALFWILMTIFCAGILAQSSVALVSVSQMGFHPSGFKTVTVYTSASAANYSIIRGDGTVIKTANFTQPKDFAGNAVNCQGNNPCLTGDFSEITASGTYHITTSLGENSTNFSISKYIYQDNTQVFNEFYDAMRQQRSTYHADMNNGTDPALTMMADGSYIMTSDQASLTLIRLSDAYRRNPTLLSANAHDFIRTNTPDMIETIMSYADYLITLQDADIKQRTDGIGFRLSTAMKVQNAFVPGPTNLTNLTVYIPNDAHTILDTVPVVSLCGTLNGTAYDSCVADAALYYKCQEDEPCINVTYNGQTGTRLPSRKSGYGLPVGWTYEFGCFYDVDLQHGNFNNAPNPCLVYDRSETRQYAVNALLAYTEAITPINQYDSTKARELLDRSIQTQQYIIDAYPAFAALDSDTGAWGTANFLLYDLTKDQNYLETAYNVRDLVEKTFVSDSTRGNEFYWQEYVRHKAILLNTSHTYYFGKIDPEIYFSNQMYGDYKDKGFLSISANGERVYQFEPSIQFQNSRFMLTEGLLAAKTTEISSDNAPFISTIADAQLSWLTGNNGVDFDPGFTNDIRSISFIFGIGHYPTEYHSRLLMSSGYSKASSGAIVGMRGTGYQFFNGSAYIYLDGKTTILNSTLGAQGNEYRGEVNAETFNANQTFLNGKTYIPGWINGAFDLKDDTDDIFNYKDDRLTYEFTETTNEMIATAVSLFAYRDAQYNGVSALDVPYFGPNNGSAHVRVTSSPLGADVWFDATYKGMTTPLGNISFSTYAGTHNLLLNLTNCTPDARSVDIAPGESISLNITLNCSAPINSTNTTNTTTRYIFSSVPIGADISIDTIPRGVTPMSVNLTAGQHNISLYMNGYIPLNGFILVTAGITQNITYTLSNASTANNTNGTNITQPILIYSSTNVTMVNGAYTTFETYNTGFTVQYDAPTNIRWYVDGVPIRTVNSDRDTFTWAGDILYVETGVDPIARSRVAHILAVGNDQTNASFDLAVNNYLNPFWDGVFGAPDALLHIYSNNQAHNFTGIIANLEDPNGMRSVALTYQYQDNESTDWKILLTNMAIGNTILRSITVNDSALNYSETYPVPQLRAHYHASPPSSGGDSGGGRSGGGGSGGGAGIPEDDKLGPELVYVVLSKDVIKDGDSLDITLDAKSDQRITTVSATFNDEKGDVKTVLLSLIKGTNTYGTWTAIIPGGAPGKHSLRKIILSDADNRTTTEEIIGRSYYVVGETVKSDEHLSLVYTLLSNNSIDPGKNVTVKIDARDAQGIKSAVAILKDIREKQQDIRVPLELTSGTTHYGTWEGVTTLNTADTTYAVYSVILSDGQNEREVRVYNQKVYVNYVKPEPSLLTGMAAGVPSFTDGELADFARKPTTPLFIGLIGMGIAMVIAGIVTLSKPTGYGKTSESPEGKNFAEIKTSAELSIPDGKEPELKVAQENSREN